jgi:fructosamine-3-kinase
MPGSLTSILQQVLSGVTGGDDAEIFFYRSVGGGSINESYEIYTKSNNRWFCKFNDAALFPGLFEKEAAGLALLRRQGGMRVPEVIACSEVGGRQILVLEWIEQGPRSYPGGGGQPDGEAPFWRLFGEQLARLHKVTRDSFGLDENNYMGALPQDNTPAISSPSNLTIPSSGFPTVPSSSGFSAVPSWSDFFIHRRLEPQIRLAADQGRLDPAAIRHFERLYPVLPSIFGDDEPPSLLHGDLWSGNFLCDSTGRPVLIDPAVYYGHRCMDLAMTTLFGGFGPAFYESYAGHYPLPPNYKEQWEICNLYPLLIHLNLFGKSYLGNILHTIQRF